MKKKVAQLFNAFLVISILLVPVLFAQAGWSTASVSGYGLPGGSIYSIIVGILNWLLALIGIIGIIGFLIAGAMYILSAGDEKRAGNAKSAMTNSIIGIIVALAGFVIIKAANAMLNGFGNF